MNGPALAIRRGMSPRLQGFRRPALFAASTLALALSGWLAAIPGEARNGPTAELEISRRPVTCIDASGILYERGTPGFERCLSEMNQAAREQAGRAEKKSEPTPLPSGSPTADR